MVLCNEVTKHSYNQTYLLCYELHKQHVNQIFSYAEAAPRTTLHESESKLLTLRSDVT
jgi:hypothetical protein